MENNVNLNCNCFEFLVIIFGIFTSVVPDANSSEFNFDGEYLFS